MTADHQLDLVSQLANEAVQEKQAEADRVRRDAVLLGLMSTAEGRRHQWEEIVESGFFAPGERVDGLAQWDTHRVAHALGVRHQAGLRWQRLTDACPERVGLMVTEAMDRLRATRTKQ